MGLEATTLSVCINCFALYNYCILLCSVECTQSHKAYTNALPAVFLVALQTAALEPSILQVETHGKLMAVIQLFHALIHI